MFASHNQCMKWITALKWAVPVWLLVCAAIVAINYAAEAKASLFNLAVALVTAYPLTAFIIKATGEDFSSGVLRMVHETITDRGTKVRFPPKADTRGRRSCPISRSQRCQG
jgi:hypothetical protein